MTLRASGLILSWMEWRWHLRQANRPAGDSPVDAAAQGDNLRLFPIVEPDLCFSVAVLLVQGRLEEVAALVSDRAWVASPPLYG